MIGDINVFAWEKVTAADVAARLDYDPHSGVFRWKPKIVRSPADSRWNARLAGKSAGCKDGRGYIVIRFGGENHKAHRLAWLLTYGRWPCGMIDHKDTDGENNAIANLREATPLENSRNQKRPKTSKSGVKGVVWLAHAKKWQAGIKVNSRSIHLGWFVSKEEAAAAYAAAAARYHGDFANTG